MTDYTTGVRSVAKALELIDILLGTQQELSLSELSELSGYPKSTVHALLSTLRNYRMITQRDNGRYYLGLHLFECGCAISAKWDISEVAPLYLEKLAAITNASSFISVVDDTDKSIVNIDQRTSHSAYRIVLEIGYKLPLRATSQGKLLLSRYSNEEALRLLKASGNKAYTQSTILDSREFIEELEKIRVNGYAVEDGEYKNGLQSVSAPVLDRHGKMNYILGVLGIFRNIHSDEFNSTINNTVSIAKQLSEAIGYNLQNAYEHAYE